MAKRIAISTLNASTIDILNTIRANLSYQYQQAVPEVKTTDDIPRVGDVLYGYPALANEFINALVNRIALVRVKSATFNNPYAMLKKGYLEFGETVEEVFVEIAKAVEFSAEKGESRELRRTLPDVRTAFHVMNWRVMYPVTIQDDDLRQAFMSINGVQDLIAKIVDSVYTAAQYDEFLLFKYLLIKGIAQGQMKPVSIGDGDMKSAAVSFRATSNKLTFMSKEYNMSGVHTSTERRDQYIFMDADFNAQYDVNVLAAAFNMDKADFMGRLVLIDDWTTFDNERFEVIRANSTQIEEVTADELALLANVKAVLVDGEWFQVYDNNNKFTEKYVASGLYWNYFYHTWKTVSSSPFSNAVVFVTDAADTALPDEIVVEVIGKDVSEDAIVYTLAIEDETLNFDGAKRAKFFNPHHREGNVEHGPEGSMVAVHPYGAVIFNKVAVSTGNAIYPAIEIDDVVYGGSRTLVNEGNGVSLTVNTNVGSRFKLRHTPRETNDGTV